MKPEATSLLGFVSQIVSSLAWPVTLLICVFLLRRHLVSMIPLLRTVKYSDVEIRFGQEVAEFKKATDNSEIPMEVSVAQKNHWETFIRLAEARPRSAIRGAWRQVESSLLETAKEKKIEIAEAAESMPMVVGALLMNQGAMSVPEYELLQKLRLLFHQAERAEPDSVKTESAAEYIGLALRLAASIDPGKNS
jgi:hypothetical protein